MGKGRWRTRDHGLKEAHRSASIQSRGSIATKEESPYQAYDFKKESKKSELSKSERSSGITTKAQSMRDRLVQKHFSSCVLLVKVTVRGEIKILLLPLPKKLWQ